MSEKRITKNEWAKQILNQLKILGDIDWQTKAWIKGEIYSAGFDEEICVLYDSYSFEDDFLKELDLYALSPELCESLHLTNKKMNEYIAKHPDSDDEQILNDKEWEEITKIIKRSYELLSKEIEKVPEEPLY